MPLSEHCITRPSITTGSTTHESLVHLWEFPVFCLSAVDTWASFTVAQMSLKGRMFETKSGGVGGADRKRYNIACTEKWDTGVRIKGVL